MEVGKSTTVHIFCFHSYTMNELGNRNAFVGLLPEHTKPPIVFCQVLCTVDPQNSEQKPTAKNFAGFHNHFTLLTMLCTILINS